MRTIIAGSRTLSLEDVELAMENCGWVPTVVISGTAPGADVSGEVWAEKRSIPVERIPADWQRFGRSAGYVRNSKMAAIAEAAVVVWDGKSKGALHMAKEATRKGLKVYLTQAEPKVKSKPAVYKGIIKVVTE